MVAVTLIPDWTIEGTPHRVLVLAVLWRCHDNSCQGAGHYRRCVLAAPPTRQLPANRCSLTSSFIPCLLCKAPSRTIGWRALLQLRSSSAASMPLPQAHGTSAL
eukprot:7320376-Prymnesium_polylepis.1